MRVWFDFSLTIADNILQVGYSVLALTQTIEKKFDAKAHVDAVEGLKSQLRERQGIVYLKRLTIILDEDSEKGFGLVRAFTLH